HQRVADPVGDGLVEVTLVAERPKIELQAFQLDAELVGHVADAHTCEVRLAGERADASELRTVEVDLVIAGRRRIGEGLQLFAGLAGHGDVWEVGGVYSRDHGNCLARRALALSLPGRRSPNAAPRQA